MCVHCWGNTGATPLVGRLSSPITYQQHQAAPPLPSASTAPSLPPVFVSPSGKDINHCGATPGAACRTLAYAVERVAAGASPLTAMATVRVLAGRYGADSCGATASRPLVIVGDGSDVTVLDCSGGARALASNSSVELTGVAIMGGTAGGAT